MSKVKVTIDDKEFEVPTGLTIIQAAHEAGVEIPYYCYHPGLIPDGNCRICLVELEGAPKLVVACKTAVADNMVVRTSTEQVETARRGVQELMLVNHPIDCPVCDQAGECKLQDYYYAYNLQQSRFKETKQHKPKVQKFGEHVMFDGERCIMCSRCVRFTHDVAQTDEIGLFNRGDRTVIGLASGKTLDNPYSMNVIDLCPVGALTSKDFRFRKRVWWLDETHTVCTGCARGCATISDASQKDNQLYRVKPRKNIDINQYWMCDEGRFVADKIADNRLSGSTIGGVEATDADALAKAAELIAQASNIVAVLSPQLCTVDALAAKKVLSEVLGAKLAVGKGRSAEGYATAEDGLLIHSDKNPNRAGVTLVTGNDAAGLDVVKSADLVVLVGLEAGAGIDGLDGVANKIALTPVSGVNATVAIPVTAAHEQDAFYVSADGILQYSGQPTRPSGTVTTIAKRLAALATAANADEAAQAVTTADALPQIEAFASVNVKAVKRGNYVKLGQGVLG